MEKFRRILDRLVSPGVDGGDVRKRLTQGVNVNLRYHDDLQYTIVAEDGKACLKNGTDTLASTNFVPWDTIDDVYAEKLSQDTLLDDEGFLDRYFERFSCDEKK